MKHYAIAIAILIILAFVIIFYNSYQEYFDNKELADLKGRLNNAISGSNSNPITGSDILTDTISNVKGYLNSFAARFGSFEGFKADGSSDDDDDDDSDEDDGKPAETKIILGRKTPININIKIPQPTYQPSRPSTAAMQLQSGNECPYCNSMPCQCPQMQTLGKSSTTLGSSETEPSTLGSAPYEHPNAYSYINQLPIQPTPQNGMTSPIEPSNPEEDSYSDTVEKLTNEYAQYNPSRNPAKMASEYNESITPEMYKDPKYMKLLKMIGHVPVDELGTVCPSLYNDSLEGKKNSDTLLNEKIARSPPRVDHSERTNIFKSDQIKAPKIFTLLDS